MIFFCSNLVQGWMGGGFGFRADRWVEREGKGGVKGLSSRREREGV
jgi:hypothetical protein